MYLITSDKLDYNLNLPTTIEEVVSIAKDSVKDINIAPHYAVLALAYKTSLFTIASTAGGNQQADTLNVLPVIVKVADVDNCTWPVKESEFVGTVPTIAPSNVERGHHLTVPIGATMSGVMAYLKKDNDLRIALFQKKYDGNVNSLSVDDTYNTIVDKNKIIAEDNKTPVYLLGFKIVPINDIVATTPLNLKINDVTLAEKAKSGNIA